MHARNGARKVFRAEMHLEGSRESVFPLLCPVEEFRWIDGWNCELLYSDSGVAEDGCVFRTWLPEQGGTETWVVCRYEPNERIEFVRMNGSRAIVYRIALFDADTGCRAEWTQIQTGLDPLGDAVVEQFTQARYDEVMGWLERSINHWLRTGTMLKREQ